MTVEIQYKFRNLLNCNDYFYTHHKNFIKLQTQITTQHKKTVDNTIQSYLIYVRIKKD